MLTYYKIRLDTHERSHVRTLLDKYCDSYIVSYEGEASDNPHCHGYLETTTKQATIRNAIRKQFGAGNGSYSLKSLDERRPLEYLAYILKEGDYECSGISEEDLTKAKEHDLKVKNQLKEKKANRRTALQVIQDELSEELPPREGETYEDYKKRLLLLVIRWYKQKGTLIRQFMIVSQVQTLLLKYHEHGDHELYCSLIERI